MVYMGYPRRGEEGVGHGKEDKDGGRWALEEGRGRKKEGR